MITFDESAPSKAFLYVFFILFRCSNTSIIPTTFMSSTFPKEIISSSSNSFVVIAPILKPLLFSILAISFTYIEADISPIEKKKSRI